MINLSDVATFPEDWYDFQGDTSDAINVETTSNSKFGTPIKKGFWGTLQLYVF